MYVSPVFYFSGVGWHRTSAPLFFRFFVFVRFAVITAGTQNLTVCDHGPAALAPWFHMIRLEAFLRDINAAQSALTLASFHEARAKLLENNAA